MVYVMSDLHGFCEKYFNFFDAVNLFSTKLHHAHNLIQMGRYLLQESFFR